MSLSLKNYNLWNCFMRDVCSPQSFIDFGFYYMISAALQRRVWVGPEHDKLFSNQYVVLCGRPALGKGRVIKPVAWFLNYHKLKPKREFVPINPAIGPDTTKQSNNQNPGAIPIEQEMIDTLTSLNYDKETVSKPKVGREEPALIPVAADASTYEALVKAMAEAYRYKAVPVWSEDQQKFITKPYTHSSLCFCLEELSSLFRKHTNDTVNFLNQAYDCGDYKYDTKTQGKDRIKSCCLNMLAGTTPNFMRSTFDDALTNEGYASRTFFIFEYAKRNANLFSEELDKDQVEARKYLLSHIRNLVEQYGGCSYTPDARQYLQEWWKTFESAPRVNNSLQLESYYGRKNIHIQKLAIAIHFAEKEAESLDYTITLEEVQRAFELLDNAEKKMHFALQFGESNPLYKPAMKALAIIKRLQPVGFNKLFMEMFESIWKKEEMEAILRYLIGTDKIEQIDLNEGVSQMKKYAYVTTKEKE